jgi:hypothetical protein
VKNNKTMTKAKVARIDITTCNGDFKSLNLDLSVHPNLPYFEQPEWNIRNLTVEYPTTMTWDKIDIENIYSLEEVDRNSNPPCLNRSFSGKAEGMAFKIQLFYYSV